MGIKCEIISRFTTQLFFFPLPIKKMVGTRDSERSCSLVCPIEKDRGGENLSVNTLFNEVLTKCPIICFPYKTLFQMTTVFFDSGTLVRMRYKLIFCLRRVSSLVTALITKK